MLILEKLFIDELADLDITGFTKGGVLFIGDTGVVHDPANFFYDDDNDRLSLGSTETDMTVGGVTKGSVFTTHSQGGMNAYDIAFHRHSATSGTFLAGARSRGSEASPAIVQDDDNLLDIFGLGFDGTDYEFAASIMIDVDGDPGDGDMPGRIVFLTTPDGSGTPIEAGRFDSQQRLITDGILSNAGSVLTLGTVGFEDMTLDFETRANFVIIDTGTGVGTFRFTKNVQISDNFSLLFSNAGRAGLQWDTVGNDSLKIFTQVGAALSSGYISIMELADVNTATRSPSASSVFGATSANPVLAGYSSDATQAGDMWGIVHDQADTRLRGGNGRVIIDTIANNDSFIIENGGNVVVAKDLQADSRDVLRYALMGA